MVDVLFIGTGDAFGSGGRRNSAILLRGPQRSVLLDCGATTLVGLKQLGIDPLSIDAVVISHFHGDHAAGLPALLLDYLYESQRERDFTVMGPPGVKERLVRMTEAVSYQHEKRPYALHFEEFDCSRDIVEDGLLVRPFPAFHHEDTKPHMVRVQLDNRSIFFSGDTGWQDDLPQSVGDSDLFICEATLMDDHFEYHLSCTRLQRERHRFDCERMVLTHLGSEVLANLEKVDFDLAEDGYSLKV